MKGHAIEVAPAYPDAPPCAECGGARTASRCGRPCLRGSRKAMAGSVARFSTSVQYSGSVQVDPFAGLDVPCDDLALASELLAERDEYGEVIGEGW